MPWTRANLEQAVVNSTSGLMAAAGLAITFAGSNADLAQPIDGALRALGYAVVVPLSPADVDINLVPDNKLELLFGVTRLYTLEACLGRYTLVDQQAGTDKQALDQLGKRIEAEMKRVQKDLLDRYGFGVRRRRHPRIGQIAAGNTWPPPPPPPMSLPPYPPGTPLNITPPPFFNP